MKKIFFFAAGCLALASCSTESLVDDWFGGGKDGAISFVMRQKNMVRSYTDMQETGHYNFGVFAYKSTETVNPVIPNYLVGYYDENNAYQKSGSTWGDAPGQEDGLSYWMYEGMGSSEYKGTYAGAALTAAYTSNKANQYLKYWDNSAPYTCFYAYAPYINSGVKSTVTYVDGTAQAATGNDTYVMCFPDGSIEAGMVEDGEPVDQSEYMYAYNKVGKANYGHDVPLQFHRLNAKVNIKFWEDIPGYKVRILDLSSSHEGVQAAASIKEAGQGDFGYRGGKFYKKNGVKINFAGATPAMKQFVGTTQTNSEPLVFKAPEDAAIGTNRYTASASASTYYAIPKGQGKNLLAGTSTDFSDAGAAEDTDFGKTGFTFHVTYELTAEDTGERIVVNNATVHVPAEYCNWKDNTHYTYIFKITKNSNGTTESTPTIDPTDPEVPTTPALYPIVFDNCTVVDWDEVEGEWNITDGNGVIYHDVQLSTYSLVSGDITVTVTDNDTYAGHAINYSNIDVTGPAGADMTKVTYDNATHKITVASGAAAGVYTVTYTCPATYDKTTHPATWTEQFVVGNAYTVALNQYEVGTKGLADSKLTITPKKDNVASEPVNPTAPAAPYLYIEYPDNFTAAQKQNVYVEITAAAGSEPYKAEVVVKKEATPGVYKLVYTVDEGSQVKVAEKTFEVKDYSFALSHSVVYLGASPVVVNATVPEATGVISMTATTGITVDNSAKTISVANNTAETETGYTVTYTLFSGVSEVQYQKSFKVRNTHAVAVTKNSISKSVGTHTTTDYSTDVNTIKTTFNGNDTSTDLSAKLSIVKSDKTTATTAGDFTITYTSANKYDLKVKNNVDAGDYYVKFVSTVGGADKAEYVHFVVTE